MNTTARQTGAWVWLTLPTAILLAIAAGGGVLIGGLYHDTPTMATQAIGQDLASLVVALPVLVISALLAWRGSLRARIIWLGSLVYVLYAYVGYAFAVRFNQMFLVYVALVGCSLYALIGGLASTDLAAVKASFSDRMPVRAVSIYLGVIAALFYLLWLSESLPASLAGQPSAALVEAGTPTNFIQVEDMAAFLPAVVIAAVSLWRRRALGYTLAGVVLVQFVLLPIAILSIVGLGFMVRQGLPIVLPQLAIFVVILLVSLGILLWCLHGWHGEIAKPN